MHPRPPKILWLAVFLFIPAAASPAQAAASDGRGGNLARKAFLGTKGKAR